MIHAVSRGLNLWCWFVYSVCIHRRRTTHRTVEWTWHLNWCRQAQNSALFSQLDVQGKWTSGWTFWFLVQCDRTNEEFESLLNLSKYDLYLTHRESRWQQPLPQCELFALRQASSSLNCPTGSSARLSLVVAAVTSSYSANVKSISIWLLGRLWSTRYILLSHCITKHIVRTFCLLDYNSYLMPLLAGVWRSWLRLSPGGIFPNTDWPTECFAGGDQLLLGQGSCPYHTQQTNCICTASGFW